MTNLRAYPRLSDGSALVCLWEVKSQAERDPKGLAELAGYDHPEAAPVATGAVIATQDEIRRLRTEVLRYMDRWPSGAQVPNTQLGDFDRQLGKALHVHASLLPADAAHGGTWNFLSAVVFPDLIWARFPNLHESRFLGNKQRNALRRVWRRQEVLGDLMAVDGAVALKEDELVGLMERSALARNRRLVRQVAGCVLGLGGEPKRDDWAREFYKRITHLTGPLLLDVLDDEELQSLVADVAAGGSWSVESGTAPKHRADIFFVRPQTVAAPDVVRSFHETMLRLAAELSEIAGSDARDLAALIEEQGGLSAAIKVAGSLDPGPQYRAAANAKRLDLTVEALAISGEFRGLFGPELIQIAEQRLADARS